MTTRMDWPAYEAGELSLGDADGCVGICCLWTDRRRLAQHLDPARYAAVGNLYSAGGIGPLARNLLANPRVRYLVVCGADLSGSGESLVALFKHGLDPEHRIAGTEVPFDRQVPATAVDHLRHRIRLIDLRGVSDPSAIATTVAAFPPLLPSGEALHFPESKPQWESLPSEGAGFVVRQTTIDRAWLESLKLLMTFGEIKQRGDKSAIRELTNVVVVVYEQPEALAFPSWLPVDQTALQQAVDSWWSNLSTVALDRLAEGAPFGTPSVPSSAGPLFWSGSMSHGHLVLNVCFIEQELSQDWVTQVAAARVLQARLAARAGRSSGVLVVASQSSYVERGRERDVAALLEQHYPRLLPWRADERGVFHIRLGDGRIVVEHGVQYLGKSGQSFSGDSADRLYKAIVNARLVLLPEHAAYLGTELQKAEVALRLGIDYQQDKPLDLSARGQQVAEHG